jgi:hypothetical protein
MPTQIHVIGTEQIAATMRKAGRDVGDLTNAHRAAAAIFTPAARALAPRLTGALAGATRPEATKDGAGVSNALPYFGPIHYGWPRRNIAAHRFVDEAVTATWSQWFPIYERAIQSACDEVRGA